jgi:DNA-directed RNA polymerase subunit RPC12/RpoP
MNTPSIPQTAKIVQCQSCNKQLKYIGSKPLITCPSCGSIVEVTKPTPSAPPPPINWAALSSSVKEKQPDKPQGKKIEFSQLEKQAIEAVKTIKALPRIPTILTGIWIAWLLLAVLFFLAGMTSYGRIAGTMVITRDGHVYSRSEWIGVQIQMTVYVSAVTAFVATVISVLVYVWSQSNINSRNPT